MQFRRIPLFILLFCAAQTWGQNTKTVRNIAELLEKTKVFVEYRKFRNTFENLNQEAGQHLLYADDYVVLNTAYNDIQLQYNDFLGMIKKDLSNLGTIHEMVARPDAFALKYLDDYNRIIQSYQNQYIPVYKVLTAPDRSNLPRGKAISPAMVIMGIELFLEIADLIKSRKTGMPDDENYVLATINAYFLKKLEMKPWAELDVPVPSRKNAPVPFPVKDRQPRKKQGRYLRADSKIVAAPIFDQLNGWIEFNCITAGKTAQKMPFGKNNGKNIGVEVLRTGSGTLERNSEWLQTAGFESASAYSTGTQFQLRVMNTGGLYVFSLDASNKVQFLYPYKQESLRACDRPANAGKDIDVLPSSFVVGRNTQQVTTLPAPDCSVQPPAERYFTITDPMPASRNEQFCVLLTRSEMDTEKLARLLENAKGDLHERLAQVFGEKMLGAQDAHLRMKSNKLNFEATHATKTVLPVIFTIRRK